MNSNSSFSFAFGLGKLDLVDFKFDLESGESIVNEVEVECGGQ